jgi:hypothetical protein
VAPVSSGLQLSASPFSFNVTYAPPMFIINVMNSGLSNISVTFSNAPADTPTATWLVSPRSNFSQSFLSGSIVLSTDVTGATSCYPTPLLVTSNTTIVCAPTPKLIGYYSFLTTSGNAVMYNGSTPLSIQPYNPLDTAQQWLINSTAVTGTFINSRYNSTLVWDVTALVFQVGTTIIAYPQKQSSYSNQLFLVTPTLNATLTATVACYTAQNLFPAANGSGVQLAASSYSFSMIPAPPMFNITVANIGTSSLTVLYSNAPADEPITSWIVVPQSNFTRNFFYGSILTALDATGTVTCSTPIVVSSSTTIVCTPPALQGNFSLITSSGSAVAYNGIANPLSIQAYNPLDLAQQWFVVPAFNGTWITSAYNPSVVWDVNGGVVQNGTAIIGYFQKATGSSNQYFVVTAVFSRSLNVTTTTIAAYTSQNLFAAPVSAIVQLSTTQYSFIVIPAPPTYLITIANTGLGNINVTFSNAPADAQSSWTVGSQTNFTQPFINGILKNHLNSLTTQ